MLQFATCFPKSVYPNGEPWAYNVRLDTLFSILKQGEVQYGEELTLRGNDMDKFYHLSGGPFLLMNSHTLLIKNLEEIKKLIINKKFIPFPPTRRLYFYSGYHVDYNLEKFPPFDGYEQEGNLNIIARAILFKPELINTWKSIGYSEVCDDFNEVVIHGLFLTLDPPSQVQHAFEKLVLNLEKFIEMGFRLTDRIIVDVLQFYEYELAELGELLWRVFRSIRTGESDFAFIFGLFKIRIDYLPEHMELLRRAKSADIVKPFLEDFVPNVFLSNDNIK
ncbi:17113_t:CDS:2, partial [Funneliformis caledonium]